MKHFMLGMGLAAAVAVVFYFGFYSKLQKPMEGTTAGKPAVSNGLKIEDIKIGDGAQAKTGNTVSVNYVGTLINGTKFDSSYDRGQPYEFTLGQGKVIQGWEQGILGMKVGGKRTLTIPPELAYGNRNVGAIPANSTLVFEVELLEVK